VTLGVDAAGNKDPLCGSYTPAGTAPGHVIVRARVDGDRLFLRFVRNDTLLRLRDLGHFEARVVETGADVESYLLADLSADELVALLRGVPADALFNDWVGPLHRLNTRRLPTQGRLTSPSGSLLQAEK
jgi:hypothetical protein